MLNTVLGCTRRPLRPPQVRGNQCVSSSLLQTKNSLTCLAYSDRLITSKDHASVQIAVADVDSNGRALSTSTSFALSGQVRAMGESDDSLNRLATKAGRELLKF